MVDTPNKINKVTERLLQVNVYNGQTIISGMTIGDMFNVFNLQGNTIYSKQANSETVSISLPTHSVYIVKVGEQSMKVAN